MPAADLTLAMYVSDRDFENIPKRIRDRAGLIVADMIGVIVGGSTDDAVESLARQWAEMAL